MIATIFETALMFIIYVIYKFRRGWFFFNFIASIKKVFQFLESNECKFPFLCRVMKRNVSLHIKNTSHILYIYVCGALHVKKNHTHTKKSQSTLENAPRDKAIVQEKPD